MKFCIYKTTYSGDKLPKYYIGSTSIKNVECGYLGTVSSRKYKDIWENEIKNNRNLFSLEILSEYKTRIEALQAELEYHIRFNVVKSNEYVNMSVANINGCHGMDVSGKNNPMYGKHLTNEHREKVSGTKSGRYGTSNYSIWLDKFGKKEADRLKKLESLKRSASLSGAGNPMFGKTRTEEQKEHQSKLLSGKNHFNFGKPAFNSGRIWMNNGVLFKMIKSELLENFIKDGWTKGRTISPKDHQ